MFFLKALGVKLGPQDKLVHDKYTPICLDLLKKAHGLGIKVILPTDFITLSKPKLGKDTEEGKDGGSPDAAAVDHKQDETDALEFDRKNTIEAVGEVNWIDLVYDDGTQSVDFSNFINQKLLELLDPEGAQAEKSKVAEQHPEDRKDELGQEVLAQPKTPEPSHCLESKAYILEFGENSLRDILSHTKDAMKVFWEGSASLYPDTFATENNKALSLDLMRIRHENEDRTEPKYSLIHGEETEVIIHQAMTKIKLDEMDNKNNVDGSMNAGFDESGSMTSTFQADNSNPAIFVCAEGNFTLRLLQGIENRCLLNMDEHPALTKEQIEDDLAILEEI